MPKVLQINSCANWGSTGKIAAQINDAARSHGWDTYLSYGRYHIPNGTSMIRVGNRISQGLALTEARLFDNDGLSSVVPTRHFVKNIKDIAPDIIHLHNLHGYYINYRILIEYLIESSIPVVWTMHDCWSFTGHCSHFVSANCDRWKTGCFDCPLKKEYPSSLFLDRAASNYNIKKELFTRIENLHIVTVSHWLEELVKQSFFQGKDIRVINNGIDISVFKPHIVEKEKKNILLGVSSVWDNSKGLCDFYLLNELIDSNLYEIVLVGLTESQVSSLPGGIIGITRTDSVEKLAELYSKADVFVNLSYEDTFPTTNLEALACGTPVVTYKTGGSPEAVSTDTGMVVEQGDVQGIYKCVQNICNKGKGVFQSNCRERAVSLYDKVAKYKEYVELYEEILR